jgi:hypothetical protein
LVVNGPIEKRSRFRSERKRQAERERETERGRKVDKMGETVLVW